MKKGFFMQNTSVIASWRNKSILATFTACCLLLFATISAFASNVTISDAANVLNRAQVQSQAASLSYPISIYTTNTFTGTKAQFQQQTANKITNSNLIVMAIDTTNRYIQIDGGKSVPLGSSQYNNAVQAFKNSYGNSDYTGATIAALQSLQTSLASSGSPSGSSSNSPNPVSSSGGLLGGFGSTALCCIGLLVVAGIAVFVFVRRRGAGFGGRGAINPMQSQGPMYPQNYPNQGYPPNYGPGYNQQGGGINPLIPGGIGALGGGLLGYELGKHQGENEAFREDGYNDNNNFNNDGNNFGAGAGTDFGNSGGGNDFGSGGGSDFGGGSFGGGGGDFGGSGGDSGGGSSF
ncbi:MAG: hypothetical protein PVS3B3_00470 [Ktedonobacteraceae bacterium]